MTCIPWDVDGLLICRERGWCRMGLMAHTLWNSGHGHYGREALAISLWLLSATGLSFAIGSGLLTLDALQAVNVIGAHGLVLVRKKGWVDRQKVRTFLSFARSSQY